MNDIFKIKLNNDLTSNVCIWEPNECFKFSTTCGNIVCMMVDYGSYVPKFCPKCGKLVKESLFGENISYTTSTNVT